MVGVAAQKDRRPPLSVLISCRAGRSEKNMLRRE
jgi:hypothetical protein